MRYHHEKISLPRARMLPIVLRMEPMPNMQWGTDIDGALQERGDFYVLQADSLRQHADAQSLPKNRWHSMESWTRTRFISRLGHDHIMSKEKTTAQGLERYAE
jgi:hypothetical protein